MTYKPITQVWSRSTTAVCQEHRDRGCPICYEPVHIDDVMTDADAQEALDAAEDAYERTYLGHDDDYPSTTSR